ncbi:hypothetical protein CDES_01215 [Corynebacterium deserti GIMN1.010]|uniref:Molybdopterin biosynthesis protein MoaD2 n=1 Tax=Corynebacterium deserti GIMN1.010 TaxID=931089 RepID=A0A0M4CJU8_9CORY|nr:MoaD/ThiS family protein [Corynebacterium deserti]ALC04722.1 hypothetical protein CDES_01215 [Corynebacterium deserti GIMN1.010]
MDIHYFAAARAARGVPQETVENSYNTLADLLQHLSAAHTDTSAAGMTLGEVFDRCTFLIDGHSAQPTASLADATRVDVLPPFAGG